MQDDPAAKRRAALAQLVEHLTTEMVDRVVAEAVRASSFFGRSGATVVGYGHRIRGLLPAALEVLTEPTPAERDRKMGELVAGVRKVSEDHNVPRLVERGLVSIAFGVARHVVRDRAASTEFTADELDEELTDYRRAFEAKLFQA